MRQSPLNLAATLRTLGRPKFPFLICLLGGEPTDHAGAFDPAIVSCVGAVPAPSVTAWSGALGGWNDGRSQQLPSCNLDRVVDEPPLPCVAAGCPEPDVQRASVRMAGKMRFGDSAEGELVGNRRGNHTGFAQFAQSSCWERAAAVP